LRHRDDAADDYLEEAIGLLEGLIDEQPSSARYRFHLARLYRTATARPYFSRREIAKEMLERLTTMLEELVEESPRSPDFRYELAMTYAGLDDRNPSRLAEERPDAEARLERALKLLEELSRDFPNVPAYENALVVAHGQLADRWRRERRDVEAEACYRMALEIGGDLVKDHPDVATYSLTYERTRVSFAEVLAVTGRTEEARGILESVLNEMDSLLSTEPGSRPVRRVADKATELLRDLLRPAR
jgi:tetratricopeptide (TPR) repeat protein